MKRALDLAGTIALLAATVPLLALAALLVRATMGSPVLFRQVRSGRDGKPFTLLKLRTMRAGEPTAGDEARLTTIGRWLRALSIDELPQLWNVARGDMSLVGPRPLLPAYVQRYSAEQRRRLDVLPGITGLAQVRGRNALSWQRRLALDAWYAAHRSLWLDMAILCRTPLAVVRRRGISFPGHSTMPEFLGTDDASGAGQ
jgi:lipopolysaccharide/colanic/teichoic acid biosynthesis glycosyltransferase